MREVSPVVDRVFRWVVEKDGLFLSGDGEFRLLGERTALMGFDEAALAARVHDGAVRKVMVHMGRSGPADVELWDD